MEGFVVEGRVRQPTRPRLFLWMGALAVVVAVVGFAKTFFHPLLAGIFGGSFVVYAHAVFLFGWVAFFLSQTLLVHRRSLTLHRKMGWAGAALAIGVVLSTLAIGTLASRRIAASGEMAQAEAELLVIMIEMLMFAALILYAVQSRKKPEVHKRLMLLALIQVLAPAWFRFRHYFPEISNPILLYSFLLADSLIVIAAVADFIRHRRVHWVYLYVGGGMVVVHMIEVFLFDSAPFRGVAEILAGPLI